MRELKTYYYHIAIIRASGMRPILNLYKNVPPHSSSNNFLQSVALSRQLLIDQGDKL